MAEDYVDILFGDYLPDLGGAPNPEMPGYLTDAVGVRPTLHGWRGMPVFADIASTSAVGGATTFIQGARFSTASTNSFFVLNVSDQKIYESRDEGVSAWTDVTPAAGAALSTLGDFFTFDQDVIFVGNQRAAIKKTLTASLGTLFTDLGGSPPIAVCGARVRQHVVLGQLGSNPYAVQWCAIGNHEDWPTPGSADARSKQSGLETLPQDLGLVTAILGGEKIGVVMQQSGLTRMTYEGGDTVYSFDTFESKFGGGSDKRAFGVVSDGKLWHWCNADGFFTTDGYRVDRLDDGTINESIINNLISHPTASSFPTSVVAGGYDTHRHLVVVGGGSTSNQIVEHAGRRSFSWMSDTNARHIFSGRNAATSGSTGEHVLYNINHSNRKLQKLSADGATVAMQTGYIELEPGFRVQIHRAHLIGTGAIGNLTLSYKSASDYSGVDVLQSGFTAMTAQSLGMGKTARASAPFFSFRVTGTGSEAYLIRGIRVYYSRGEPTP